MRIQHWKLADVKPYAGNPRHNDAAVAAVAASIQEFGFRQPIVVDEQGVIIVGHTPSRLPTASAWKKCPSTSPLD
jgi:ParB-like chromosome segregation protein Spo0J